VPLHCEGCVKDVSDSLNKLDGISNIEANLKDQLIRIEGTGKSYAFLLPLVTALVNWYSNYQTSTGQIANECCLCFVDRVLISICNIVPPSAIVAAIEATGRDAILRGSGGSNSKSFPRRV
jgi:copper chaperone for superoxide dismutase